jgi:hypothetical protein
LDREEVATFYLEEAQGYRDIASQIATPIVVEILLALAHKYERAAACALSGETPD